jgi:hypothetical protein
MDTAAKLKASGAFDVAAEEYENAYKVAPSAAPLREALECYKQLGQSTGQVSAAQRLLDKHAKELKGGEQAALKKLLEAAKAKIGQIDLIAESGATVQLDGKDVGTTPLPGPLSADAGSHAIVVKKEGFELFEKPVDVTAKSTVTVEAKLEPTITTAEISVKEAAGIPGTVLIDGQKVGPAPYRGRQPLGKHQVSLESPTYAAPAKEVTLVKREVADVVLEAAPTTGKVTVATADKHGVIRIDGKLVGDGTFSGDLTSGEHLVEVTRDGYKPFSQTIAVVSGKPSALKVTLEPAAPVVVEEKSSDSGIFGAIRIAGQLQTTKAGNELQLGCDGLKDTGNNNPTPGTTPPANTCTSGSPAGGGLFGILGYGWKYFGLEMLVGATGDVTRGTAHIAGHRDNTYSMLRIGGLAAFRPRAMIQTKAIRVSLAVGPAIAERVVASEGDTTDYFSPAFSGDFAFGIRFSNTTTFTIGSMLWMESAKQGPTVSRPEQNLFRLFSGPQTMILPHMGFEFGP